VGHNPADCPPDSGNRLFEWPFSRDRASCGYALVRRGFRDRYVYTPGVPHKILAPQPSILITWKLPALLERQQKFDKPGSARPSEISICNSQRSRAATRAAAVP
jgi:hypothetical protein